MYSSQMSNPNKLCGKPPRRHRGSSDEIDVFEAARYFSDTVDGVSIGGRIASHGALRAERKSLDMLLESMHPQQPKRAEKLTKEKKSKMPSSPGAKLASFLNSFFITAASKKKSKSLKHEEGLGGKKVRRFSISHSQSIRGSESNHIHSSKNSNHKSTREQSNTAAWHDKRVTDEKRKVLGNERGDVWSDVVVENKWVLKGSSINGGYGKDWINKMKAMEKPSFRRDEEEGSDCSSDLFELKNCDLTGDLSSGLPVYGTTDVKAITSASCHQKYLEL